MEPDRDMAPERDAGTSVTPPLLTILIPTYERAERARILVTHLLPFVQGMDGKVELIVSINPTTNSPIRPSVTERHLEELRSPFVQIIVQPRHFATAEEHIFESQNVCHGEYILFHGDDDLTVLSTLQSLIRLLGQGRYDFIAFSSTMIDADGGDAGGQVPRMNADIVEIDFVPGALSLGFMCGLAGLSNIVQRRRLLSLTNERNIFEHEPVYAHVVWRLKAFHGCRMAIINRPLVYYRGDESDAVGAHFRKLAVQRNVGDFHFWGLGIIRHLDLLEREGVITIQDISTAFDFRRDGTHFRLLDNIVGTIEAQTLLAVGSTDDRNRVAGEDLQFMTDWLLRIDPAYNELVQIIHDIHALRSSALKGDPPRGYVESGYSTQIYEDDRQKKADQLHKAFHRVMEHRTHFFNKFIGLVGRYQSYSIYRHLQGLAAFDDERGHDCQDHLRIVDLRPADDSIIVLEFRAKDGPCDLDTQLSKIHQMIDEARARQSFDRRTHSWPQLDELKSIFKKNAETLQSAARETRAIAQDAGFLAAVVNLDRQTSPLRWWRRSLTGFNYEYYTRTYRVQWFPLRHFLEAGWREGHNPSAAFNTRGYLAANPDVAAAGVNPLLHFLAHGREEKRRGWY